MITEILGAPIVQDHLYAIGRSLSDGGRPIVPIGDCMICANGAAVGELVVRARGSDHCRAEALRVLDGERADATRATVDQESVTLNEADQFDIGVNSCRD